MIYDHSDFYVPNLYTFQNGNTYLGSFHGLRFRLKPGKQGEEGQEEPVIQCLTWYGEYCLEKSQVVSEADFPLSDEGHQQMLDWLDGEFQKMERVKSQNDHNETGVMSPNGQ